jgi:hypothetical protein
MVMSTLRTMTGNSSMPNISTIRPTFEVLASHKDRNRKYVPKKMLIHSNILNINFLTTKIISRVPVIIRRGLYWIYCTYTLNL